VTRAQPPSSFERIWALVRQVPRGRVVTYGQVARIVGAGTPRIVGFAMSSAPEDVPWQRVINSRGRISARAGGDEDPRQRRLLEREGVRFDDRGVVDLDAYGWLPPV
jgi:methylated-DNA-protein-cysteine methyltransferase-like protein